MGMSIYCTLKWKACMPSTRDTNVVGKVPVIQFVTHGTLEIIMSEVKGRHVDGLMG